MYQGCHIIRYWGDVFPVKFYRERRTMFLRFLLSGSGLSFISEVSKVVHQLNIDIVHCASFFPSVLGICLSLFVKTPIIGDVHASAMIEGSDRGAYVESIIGAFIERLFGLFLSALVVPTSELAGYFKAVIPWMKNSIYVVPSCVDLPLINNRDRVAHRMQVAPNNEHILIYYGSPYPENVEALTLFLQIVSRLVSEGYDVVGVVAGKFQKPSIDADGIVFTGWLSQDDLSLYLDAADIGIVPYFLKSRGIATRIIENISLGNPTITTSDGLYGLEFVRAEGGLFVADSLETIVGLIKPLLDDESLMSSSGKNARRAFLTHLSPSAVGWRLEKTYNSVLTGKPA